MEDNKIFKTADAANYLSLKKSTLEAWRFHGIGPDYVKMGRSIRYRQEDLDRFINQNTHKNSSES